MTVITIALLVLVATSIASSQVLPSGYSCGWEKSECKGSQLNVATCNCKCPGHLLCCDPSILNDYNYPVWQGKAPFCEGQCSTKCGSDITNCWWKSACGNGKKCWTGNKVLCATPKNKDKIKQQALKKLPVFMQPDEPADGYAEYKEAEDVHLQDNY